MSSTNRSEARDSHIADYYVTPKEPIRQFLLKFCNDEQIDLSVQNHFILDPCAGGDANNDMSYPAVLFEF
jgi:cephalosporin hydroxylase